MLKHKNTIANEALDASKNVTPTINKDKPTEPTPFKTFKFYFFLNLKNL